jgi:hypothetical protein
LGLRGGRNAIDRHALIARGGQVVYATGSDGLGALGSALQPD